MNKHTQIEVEPVRKGSKKWKVLLSWEGHTPRELVRDGMSEGAARLLATVCRRGLANGDRWITSVIEQGEK
ncbi:MAG: hypothetical protein ACREP9_14475 [Candidatus Dormibacteraceae bacterium]